MSRPLFPIGPFVAGAYHDLMDDLDAVRFGKRAFGWKANSGQAFSREIAINRRYKIILALTGLYLLFELSFSARLLDTAGGLVGIDEIKTVEDRGRMLSGCALGLAIWGFAPWRNLARGGAILAICLITCIPAMRACQQWLVDYLVDHQTGEERRVGLILSSTIKFAALGHLQIPGIDITKEGWASPSGLVFSALYPAIAASESDIASHVAELRDGIRAGLTDCHTGPGCLGSAQEFAPKWLESMRRARDLYGVYVMITAPTENAQGDQNRAWQTYVSKLKSTFFNAGEISSISPAYWAKIREQVRAAGIPVPDDWRPDDKLSFMKAVTTARGIIAEKKLPDDLKWVASLPPGMDFMTFFKSEALHHWISQKFKIPEDFQFSPAPVDDARMVGEQVYRPLLTAAADAQISLFGEPAENFEPRGKRAEVGRAAAERTIVPPIALAFSLVGALGHLVKLLFMAVKISARSRLAPLVFALIPLAIVAGVACDSEVTRTGAWRSLESATASLEGEGVAQTLHWIATAEMVVYPLNRQIAKVLP